MKVESCNEYSIPHPIAVRLRSRSDIGSGEMVQLELSACLGFEVWLRIGITKKHGCLFPFPVSYFSRNRRVLSWTLYRDRDW